MHAAGPAAVKVTDAINLHSVRCPFSFARHLGPDFAVAERAIRFDVEDTDVTALCIVDEELALVS